METVPSTLTKTYFPRGPLQQFCFVDSTSFRCFRCSETKKSKLINVYSGDWSKRLCNGCHERLLSLYEIKAGTAAEDQKVEDLVAALLSAVAADDQSQAELRLRASEKRAEQLSAESVRFLATAEHVAGELQEDPQLEWSPAVIGLCKAVEWEVSYQSKSAWTCRLHRMAGAEDLCSSCNARTMPGATSKPRVARSQSRAKRWAGA